MDVDHYRPKAKVEEDTEHTGYWWLAYDWRNLLYSCRYCNQEHKKNFFPLLKGGIRARVPEDELTDERPALLNPYVDDAEKCFGYEWVRSAQHMVEVTGVDCEGRGRTSIQVLGLNRYTLAEQRAEVIGHLRTLARTMEALLYRAETEQVGALVARAGAKIREATAARKQFAGFRRYYFRSRGLDKFVATD